MRTPSSLAALCLFVLALAPAGELRAQPQIQAANITANEGNTGSADAVLTVTLSAAATGVVTVAFATENLEAIGGGSCGGSADYVTETGTIQFNPGVTRQSLGIARCGDTADEPNENFRVRFSNAVGATIQGQTARITIADDDDPAAARPTISIGDATIVEGNASSKFIDFTVSLSAPASQVVEVSSRTLPGTATLGSGPVPCGGNDVRDGSSSGIFNPGVTIRVLSFEVCSDTVDEPDETFQVVLRFLSGATLGDSVGVGTIIDDDVPALPTISISDATVIEGTGGNTTAPVLVTISAGSFDLPVSATLIYHDLPPNNTLRGSSCTSTPGVDFSPMTATMFFSQSVTQGFFVLICGDTVDEVDETFQIELSNPVGAILGDRLATVTIVDDDLSTIVVIPVNPVPPTLSTSAESVDEGSAAVFLVRLSRAATQPVTVQFATSPKTANAGTSCASTTDYLTRSGTLTFPPGTTIRAVGVPTCDDFLGAESPETFVFVLSSAVNATIGLGFVVGTIRE